MSSIRRPEHTAPPEIFYGVEEAEKYTNNTRIMQIQVGMMNLSNISFLKQSADALNLSLLGWIVALVVVQADILVFFFLVTNSL